MTEHLLGVPGLTFGGAGNWVIVAILVAALIRILPRLKELEIGKNAGLRREFIEEMHALRVEVSESREEVKSLRSENEALRKEVRELHGVIDGMRRENLTANIEMQRAQIKQGGQEPSKPMKRALGKLDEIAESEGKP